MQPPFHRLQLLAFSAEHKMLVLCSKEQVAGREMQKERDQKRSIRMTVLQSCLHQLGWTESSQLYPKYLYVDRMCKKMTTHMEALTFFLMSSKSQTSRNAACDQSPCKWDIWGECWWTGILFRGRLSVLKMGIVHCTDHPTIHPIQVSLIFK